MAQRNVGVEDAMANLESGGKGERTSMRDAIAVLWAKRWPILLLSLAAALATLLVNYLLHD